MRDLPRSVYSTPGMIGMHDAGIVPETDAEFGGLQRVYAARTAAIAKARAPCFGHVTVKNRGDVPYRGAFLVVAMLHVPDKPDIIALHGCWVLDKEDLPRYYNLKGIMRVDRASKEAWEEMDDDACALVPIWAEVTGFAHFEPSIAVVRNGVILPADRDAIKLSAILRRHPWRTMGWLRLESLASLTGTASWTMRMMTPVSPALVPPAFAMISLSQPLIDARAFRSFRALLACCAAGV
jgi:hypothetical protein